jgi:peptidoglycan/xylan/chitin deacetylase (PgdA/CDA1 family)
LVLALTVPCLGWGSLEDIRYKVKPIDGSLWSSLHGGGRMTKGRDAARQILFSFDDGPDHRSTPVLLDHLDRYGVKALFFVNGHRMHTRREDGAENREVLREIHRRGHVIGNHTFAHRDLSTLSESEVRHQIDSVSHLVESITGERTWLFRPPFGKLGRSSAHLARGGYTVVMWSIDPLDWQTNDPAEVFRRVVSAIEAHPRGGIIDLHDTNRATVEAFPLIMEWLEQRNAELAAMGEQVYRVVGIEAFYRSRRRR